MEKFQTILSERQGSVVTLWLNRPEVHNALNERLILELTSFFTEIEDDPDIRIVILRGKGTSFCSGADLLWMKNGLQLSQEENLRECRELSELFATIYRSSKIVIAVVHGNVFGGGNGLVAVCDFAFCDSGASFSLSETRIGMVAASITPYLMQKIRIAELKNLVFSARHFTGDEAAQLGLVNRTFPSTDLVNRYVGELILLVLANGKEALKESKYLINRLSMLSMASEILQIPAILARIRISKEAQEGFSSFLEKRRPNWQEGKDKGYSI